MITVTEPATAVAPPPTKLMTAAELLEMPRGDGKKYELIRGELIEKMPTGRPHAIVVIMIGTVLNLFVGPRNYGEVGGGDPGYLLEIGPDTVRAPDVAWTAPGRIPLEPGATPTSPPTWPLRSNPPAIPTPKCAAKPKCGSVSAAAKFG